MNIPLSTVSKFRNPLISATGILLLFMIGTMPGLAFAQSCKSTLQATTGDPVPFGAAVPVSVEIGAGAIDGGFYLDVDKFTFGPTVVSSQGIFTCVNPGNDVTFNNDIVTDCTGIDGNPVVFFRCLPPVSRSFCVHSKPAHQEL